MVDGFTPLVNKSISSWVPIDKITGTIIGAAINVHRELGPGLLESAYEACLVFDLAQTGLKVEQQKPLPIVYKGITLECGYRLDLMIEDEVIQVILRNQGSQGYEWDSFVVVILHDGWLRASGVPCSDSL